MVPKAGNATAGHIKAGNATAGSMSKAGNATAGSMSKAGNTPTLQVRELLERHSSQREALTAGDATKQVRIQHLICQMGKNNRTPNKLRPSGWWGS